MTSPILLGSRQAHRTADNVIRILSERILTSVYAPGERLPAQRVLGAELNVSRETLSAAIKHLVNVGCVEIRRGRAGGAFVCGDEQALRTIAVALAAEHASEEPPPGSFLVSDARDAEIALRTTEHAVAEVLIEQGIPDDHLVSIERTLQSVAHSPSQEYSRNDMRFHIALAQATGSRTLVDFATEAWARVAIVKARNDSPLWSSCGVTHANVQHAKLLNAIRARDAERAARIIGDHLQAVIIPGIEAAAEG